MTPQAIALVVAKLYTAAGRHYGKVEFEVYADALDDIDDDTGQQACRLVIRNCDFSSSAPNPKLMIDAARSVQRNRRAATPALVESTDNALPMEENARRMREAVARLRHTDLNAARKSA